MSKCAKSFTKCKLRARHAIERLLGGIKYASPPTQHPSYPPPVGAAQASIPVDSKGNPITLSQLQEGVGPPRVFVSADIQKGKTHCSSFKTT